jgi:predicted alpha/beta-hydrolase family hydrolase
MEAGSPRPDRAPVCEATVRAAAIEAARRAPGLPLFAGGKSMGGRMSSQAQAAAPLPSVRGLVFFGFPLHPPKAPALPNPATASAKRLRAGPPKGATARAEHLARVDLPMLFLQGTRDELADLALLRPIIADLAPRAQLSIIEGADHSFAVRVRDRGGLSAADVLTDLADRAARWMREQPPRSPLLKLKAATRRPRGARGPRGRASSRASRRRSRAPRPPRRAPA